MELLYIITICVVCILCLMQYLLYYTPKARLFNKIPGLYKYPIIGNLFDFLIDPVKMFRLVRIMGAKYKKIYSVQIFHYRLLNVINPDDAEIILSNPNHITKSELYKFLQPWLNEGLLTSNGEKWHERRKILAPAFHFNILRQFCKIFDEKSKNIIEHIKSQDKQAIEVHPIVTKCALHSICETAMGTQIEEDSNFKQYNQAIHTMSHYLIERLTKVWMHNDFIFKFTPAYKKHQKCLSTLHGFTTSVIRQRKTERESSGDAQIIHKEDIENDVYMNGRKKKLAMLDLLLSAEAEGKIDETGIREEVDTFMFGGHDTVGTVMRYLLMALANHKDVQDKIVEELDEIFGDSERTATMDDLNKMNYLKMCIKETLRLYPGAPLISRLLKEDVQLTDYLIPSGTICHIHIYDLHRDPSIYPSPEDFIPERFTPENSAKRHPYAYIPFSAGIRNCIGQKYAMLKLKSLMSRILRNFLLEAVTKPQDVVFTADMTLQTTHPIYVKFVPRNK